MRKPPIVTYTTGGQCTRGTWIRGKADKDGWVRVVVLGLIISLLLRYPLRSMSLAFKLIFTFIVGIIVLIVLFEVLPYRATGLNGSL